MTQVHTSTLRWIEAVPVDIEIAASDGADGPKFPDLQEQQARETRVRVRAALASYVFDRTHRVRTFAASGPALDLPIAVGLLGASATRLDQTAFVGELSLSGDVRPVRGALAHVRAAIARGLPTIVVPAGNAAEVACVADRISIRKAYGLSGVAEFLTHGTGCPVVAFAPFVTPAPLEPGFDALDLNARPPRCPESARTALREAVLAGRNVLLIAPPGAGKTMLARRVPDLLPPLTSDEQIEVATIASCAGLSRGAGVGRPFRAPHHTASTAALVGGGATVRPGEATLAHHGVLFLDEVPEIRGEALDALHRVLDDGEARLTRLRATLTMPAAPLVIAAMSPCPCGWSGAPRRTCTCTKARIDAYRARAARLTASFVVIEWGTENAS